MTCEEIIKELKANASEKYKANVVKMGIPAENSIGVSVAVVRAVAKKAGKSNELANMNEDFCHGKCKVNN